MPVGLRKYSQPAVEVFDAGQACPEVNRKAVNLLRQKPRNQVGTPLWIETNVGPSRATIMRGAK
jgi:hypothetical protein